MAETVFPKLLIKTPMGRFFWKKFFKRVAYEKIKLKHGKDVKIYENLGFVYYDWLSLGNPTTLEDESQGTFEELVGRD